MKCESCFFYDHIINGCRRVDEDIDEFPSEKCEMHISNEDAFTLVKNYVEYDQWHNGRYGRLPFSK